MHKPRPCTNRIHSMRCACIGIRTMLQSQHNARIHAAATLIVIGMGIFLRLSAGEWCWLALAIAAVWTAEAFNTAFELLADAAVPEFHPLVGRAKDIAAGAVLIAAVGSVVIGVFILGPYVAQWFQ